MKITITFGKDRVKPGHMSGENVKWCMPFGKQFVSSSKDKTFSYCMNQQLYHWYISKRNEYICLHKNLYTNVHSSHYS